jgi:bacillithiol system protein YtxJ
MSWQPLTDLTQWQAVQKASFEQAQVVFKHSTRCSISAMAERRFEQSALFKNQVIPCWHLDLISFRSLSDQIASDTKVKHESPQCIVIQNGEVIYTASHGLIDASAILEKI